MGDVEERNKTKTFRRRVQREREIEKSVEHQVNLPDVIKTKRNKKKRERADREKSSTHFGLVTRPVIPFCKI